MNEAFLSRLVYLSAFFAAGTAGFFLTKRCRKDASVSLRVLTWSLFALPFASGGFYTYTAPLLCLPLLYALWKGGTLRLSCSWPLPALTAVAVAYLLTPLWAADRGMAIFGFVRFLPVLLFALNLLALNAEERRGVFALVPLSGAVMTALSLALLYLPAVREYVTVNGRLSGFFEYPNTFSLFLLAGFILSAQKERLRAADWICCAVLLVGILASGSRTSFLLLVLSILLLCIVKRRLQYCLCMGALLVGSLAVAFAADSLGVLQEASRYTSIRATSGTFLARLPYYKDALGIIVRNPFGLGYWGYRAVLAGVQTGRYAVAFVHNGLLQLLLEVGWLPALLLAFAACGALLSKRLDAGGRILLLVLLAHCMLDFDLQFSVIWLLLLPLLNWGNKKERTLRCGRKVLHTLGVALCALCLWLGVGDALYQAGANEACLAVTSFHTEAQLRLLAQTDDTVRLDALADSILDKNEACSLAYSAKANAAFSRGDITRMITYKRLAIANNRYGIEEYCNYIEMLTAARNLFLQAGDTASAEFCRAELLSLPEQMARIAAETDPLAAKTGEDSSMTLPEGYAALLAELDGT